MHRGAERPQRQLGVISRGGRLLDDRRALGLQAGEQHGALDLGARDLGAIADALQRGTVNGQRRLLVVRLDARAHQLERHDDPSHRALRERRVADERPT